MNSPGKSKHFACRHRHESLYRRCQRQLADIALRRLNVGKAKGQTGLFCGIVKAQIAH